MRIIKPGITDWVNPLALISFWSLRSRTLLTYWLYWLGPVSRFTVLSSDSRSRCRSIQAPGWGGLVCEQQAPSEKSVHRSAPGTDSMQETFGLGAHRDRMVRFVNAASVQCSAGLRYAFVNPDNTQNNVSKTDLRRHLARAVPI